MSKSLWYSGINVTQNDATTRYYPIVGGITSHSVTEANQEQPVRQSGTTYNFWFRLSANNYASENVATLRKSRADCNQHVHIGAGVAQLFEDSVNSDAFAATDEIAVKFPTADDAGTVTGTVTGTGVLFDADTAANGVTLIGSVLANNYSVEGNTYFNFFGGRPTVSTTEANSKARIRKACTAYNWYVMATLVRATATTVATRVTGNPGNMTQSVTVAYTAYEDAANNDSLVVGDDYNGIITTDTGADNFQLRHACVNIVNTSGYFFLGMGSASLGQITATKYLPWGCDPPGAMSAAFTEAQASHTPKFAFDLTELAIYCATYTGAGSNVCTIRKDLGAGNVEVSLAAATTWYVNSTDTDSFDGVDDELSLQCVLTSTTCWIGGVSAVGLESGGASAIMMFLADRMHGDANLMVA